MQKHSQQVCIVSPIGDIWAVYGGKDFWNMLGYLAPCLICITV